MTKYKKEITVADLISLLQKEDPTAIVVLENTYGIEPIGAIIRKPNATGVGKRLSFQTINCIAFVSSSSICIDWYNDKEGQVNIHSAYKNSLDFMTSIAVGIEE